MNRPVMIALVLTGLSVVAAPARADQDVTLVVPFELERFDARVAWLGEGAAVGLTEALRDRGVPVISRDDRLAALERLQLPPGASLTRATIIKVAELVGAARVVTGRVAARDADLAIEARVLDIASAQLDAPISETTPVPALLGAFVRMAAAIDGRGEIAANAAAGVAPSVPAFELYVRGLVAGSNEAQERYLAQALTMAAGYQDVRQALWDVRTARGAHERALAALGPATGTGAGAGALGPGVRRAWSLIELGRFDDAFAALTTLDAGTRAAVVANLLGVVQLRLGATPHTGKATYYVNQAVERDGLDGDYCFNLGYAYWQEKDALAAAYWLREAVRRNPADGDAHFVLAAALATSGAAPEAERERELARRLSERWEAASGDTVPRGLERLKDQVRPASSAMVSAIAAGAERNQRELAAFHLDTARRAVDDGRDPEAIRELQRALYLTPYDAAGLLLLGQAQARSGLLQEAIDTYKIAVWSAESAAVQVALGEALLRTRDAAGALRAAERALVLEPQSAAAADLAARARAARPGGPA
ncbi:MAG: hypothetical protein IT181_22835 [Acidobacteria bacterium]|nr:hypothetical protein [Acidobacteriota bacterium]